MYLVINNLPRHLRFKQQNILLVALIPGPNEPERISPYLVPLVDELKELAEGVRLESGNVIIRAMLSCAANDIPAARKVCGFAGHTARLGCTRCKKVFPTERFGERPDYSGYDCANWEPRTDAEVKASGLQFLQARTKQKQKELIRENGCRYSPLQDLPYFSVVRNTIIDPMHNLYLGTAKHVLETWKREELLTKEHFDSVQQLIDNINVPRDIGRIPKKIKSGFSEFTADQWRLWTILYSVISLHGILRTEDLECWRQFVIACTLFSSKITSISSVNLAHQYIVRFCQLSSVLYTKAFCTINMHLHCHLRDCILDYGPVHSFWLFSFERYNGILGDIPTNHRALSVQLMRKFVQFMNVTSYHDNLPGNLKDTFAPYLTSGHLTGSIMQTAMDPTTTTVHMHLKQTGNINEICWEKQSSEVLSPPLKERILTSLEMENIYEMYKHIYNSQQVRYVNRTVIYSNRAVAGTLNFATSQVSNSSAVMALWGFDHPKLLFGELDSIVKSIAKVESDGEVVEKVHILAVVSWYKTRENSLRRMLGYPWTICDTDFEHYQPKSFIPLSRIMSRCARTKYVIQPVSNQEHANETVTAFAPVDYICSESIFKHFD